MTSHVIYRLVLLGLLPVIAVLLYLEGMNYDPSLIEFQFAESAANPMGSFFPSEIDGLTRTGQLKIYTNENLYEYVNGHAEYFISAGFKGLTVGEYGRKEIGKRGPDAVVDMYDMGKSIYAFGVLSDESGGKTDLLRPGVTGIKRDQSAVFIKGQYYVRIALYDKSLSLDGFIKHLDWHIGVVFESLPFFSELPDIGEVVQTRFVREAYRGLEFVNNVIEREYNLNGETFKVFLFTGKEGDVQRLVSNFIEFFGESGIEYHAIERIGRTFYEVKDPYEGDWVLVPLSESVYGIYGHYNNEIINLVLKGPAE